MFTAEGLLALHGWGHRCFAVLLDHAAKLPAESFTKPLEGFGWPSVRDQLLHIAEAEAFWVTRARGEDFSGWDYKCFATADEVREAYASACAATREFFGALTPAALIHPRRIEFSGGGSTEISPALMLCHIVTHGFHHKGQAAAMCRLLGHPPPETDMDAVASP